MMAVVGCSGVAVTATPMNVPVDIVAAIAFDMPVAADCAAAGEGVVMVAVTSIEPATIERLTATGLTAAAAATAAM